MLIKVSWFVHKTKSWLDKNKKKESCLSDEEAWVSIIAHKSILATLLSSVSAINIELAPLEKCIYATIMLRIFFVKKSIFLQIAILQKTKKLNWCSNSIFK